METTYYVFDTKLQRGLEYNEGLYWSALYQHPSGQKRHFRRTETAFLMAMPTVNTLAFNRVIGLGLIKSATQTEISEIIKFFRKAGSSRFFVQLSPFAQPGFVDELLALNGFTYYNNWVKFYRPADRSLPPVQTELEIVSIDAGKAHKYGQLLLRCFGWDDPGDEIARAFANTVGQPGFRHYFALDDGKPIAAAAMYTHGVYASMAIAGTLEGYRGKGAQSALLSHRILDARKLGCKHILSETAEELPGKPVPSSHNMKKFGFEVAYLRPNYIYNF